MYNIKFNKRGKGEVNIKRTVREYLMKTFTTKH